MAEELWQHVQLGALPTGNRGSLLLPDPLCFQDDANTEIVGGKRRLLEEVAADGKSPFFTVTKKVSLPYRQKISVVNLIPLNHLW